MASSKAPIALILGAGPRIGAASAARYKALGYSVALVSRRGPGPEAPSESPEGYLQLRADLADASAYAGIFGAVQRHFGGGGGVPDVVVFNAASLTLPAAESPDNIFSADLDGLQRDLDLGVKGAFVAAREAYRLWTSTDGESGGKGRKRHFIYTGNCLSKVILKDPRFVTLGIVKSASASWVGLADKLYKEKGYRFFYADQREADGGPAFNVSADAHAELFGRLAQDPEPWPSYITFHDGTKFVEFEDGR